MGDTICCLKALRSIRVCNFRAVLRPILLRNGSSVRQLAVTTDRLETAFYRFIHQETASSLLLMRCSFVFLSVSPLL